MKSGVAPAKLLGAVVLDFGLGHMKTSHRDDAANAEHATPVQQLGLKFAPMFHELEDDPALIRRAEVDGESDHAGFRTLERTVRVDAVSTKERNLHGDDLAALERCHV